MRRHNIPTAHYAVCRNEKELKDALGHFPANGKIVVKADGLAAGKGVVDRRRPRRGREGGDRDDVRRVGRQRWSVHRTGRIFGG